MKHGVASPSKSGKASHWAKKKLSRIRRHKDKLDLHKEKVV